jgi:hypothetical protein
MTMADPDHSSDGGSSSSSSNSCYNYLSHQQLHTTLAWSIIVLAPIVALILIYGRPPTYGKLQFNPKPAQRGQTQTVAQTQSHDRHWLGPLFPSKWCWIVFESPNWIWTVIILMGWCCTSTCHSIEGLPQQQQLLQEQEQLPTTNLILLGWFTIHYIYRSLIFPMYISSTSKFPLGAAVTAFLYCAVNGYLQVYGLMYPYPSSLTSTLSSSEQHTMTVTSPIFLIGCTFMVIGFSIAYQSDHILLTMKHQQQQSVQSNNNNKTTRRMKHTTTPGKTNPLKKKNDDYSNDYEDDDNDGIPTNSNTDATTEMNNVNNSNKKCMYHIPKGGLFEYVSCPHYLGEIIEWIGFYIASGGTIATMSFVLWTCSNLIPRALATHEWYKTNNYIQDTEPQQQGGGNQLDEDTTRTTTTATSTSPKTKISHQKAIIPFIL